MVLLTVVAVEVIVTPLSVVLVPVVSVEFGDVAPGSASELHPAATKSSEQANGCKQAE